jgi:Uma2 family endonuclease
MRRKRHEYFEGGTRLVWEIDPKTRTAAVYRPDATDVPETLTEAGTLDGGDVLVGFSLCLKDLFAEPDRHG